MISNRGQFFESPRIIRCARSFLIAILAITALAQASVHAETTVASLGEIGNLIRGGQTTEARELIDRRLLGEADTRTVLQLHFLRATSHEADGNLSLAVIDLQNAITIYQGLDELARLLEGRLAEALTTKLVAFLIRLAEFDEARAQVQQMELSIPGDSIGLEFLNQKINEEEQEEIERQKIAQVLNKWEQGFETADEVLLRQIFSPTSEFYQRLNDPATIQEMSADTVDFVLKQIAIEIQGNTATAVVVLDIVVNGIQREADGRNVFLFVREVDEWKISEL